MTNAQLECYQNMSCINSLTISTYINSSYNLHMQDLSFELWPTQPQKRACILGVDTAIMSVYWLQVKTREPNSDVILKQWGGLSFLIETELNKKPRQTHCTSKNPASMPKKHHCSRLACRCRSHLNTNQPPCGRTTCIAHGHQQGCGQAQQSRYQLTRQQRLAEEQGSTLAVSCLECCACCSRECQGKTCLLCPAALWQPGAASFVLLRAA